MVIENQERRRSVEEEAVGGKEDGERKVGNGRKIKRVSLAERVKKVQERNVEEMLEAIASAVKSDQSQRD